jgi:hypothetical protein
MIEWYSPRLLLKAGVEVVVSTLFGQHADQRTVQALSGNAKIFDYSGSVRREIEITPRDAADKAASEGGEAGESPIDGDFWIDYVADVGDGWNSTYSVAWLLSRTKLPLKEKNGSREHPTRPGRLLVFGGDQVYPTASREEYERRFLGPYRTAFSDGNQREPTDVFAIPGNHDWYDSLRSFSRIFFTTGPFADIPQTATPQTRSYFAAKLPRGWWLLGTDVQLGSDIDANQYEYFKTVSEHFASGDRVILCTAEPHWLKPKRAEKRESLTAESALDRLERELLGNRVAVFIAGDVHHYMRYESSDPSRPVHKITAGGGGAFLHPTHRSWGRTITESPTKAAAATQSFQRPKSAVFPSPSRSFRLSLWNWLFAYKNPRFGLLTGLLYVMFALMMIPAFNRYLVSQKDKKSAAAQQELADQQEEYRKLLQQAASTLKDAEVRSMITAPSPAAPRVATSARSPAPWRAPNPKQLYAHIHRRYAVGPPSGKPPIVKKTGDKVTAAKPIRRRPDPGEQKTIIALKQLTDRQARSQQRLEELRKNARQDYVKRMRMAWDSARSPNAAGQDAGTPKSDTDGGPTSPSAQPAATSEDSSEDALRSPWSFLIALTVQELKLPSPFESMLAIVVFACGIAGFVAFTDIPNPGARFVLGALHGAVHWMAAYLLTFGLVLGLGKESDIIFIVGTLVAVGVLITWRRVATNERMHFIAKAACVLVVAALLVAVTKFLFRDQDYRPSATTVAIFILGWLVGSTIMGAYLFLTHTLTGQHWNEAFSSVQCEDWKCFLRLRIAPDGGLTIFPVGIPRICRSWDEDKQHSRPKPKSPLTSVLIETPIEIP